MNRPGSTQPNELERAVLSRMAAGEPAIGEALTNLHVLSREFTGVGSLTTFQCEASTGKVWDRHVGLDPVIRMPRVPNGMGAVLFMNGDQPQCLELYTHGNEHWDGLYDGFSLGEDTA